MQYRQIEIDIDVHRWIENQRTFFEQTPNDILRTHAGVGGAILPKAEESPGIAGISYGADWVGKGVRLPGGTLLRMFYNGEEYTGQITEGAWLVNGVRHRSPSAAAGAMTGVSLNGWIYWEALTPGARKWRRLAEVRPTVARRHRRH